MSKRVTWGSFESHWVERNADVGKHDGGAAPRSVDGLYDDCAKLIRQHPSAPVRLFFHADGVLMQCGFAAEVTIAGEYGEARSSQSQIFSLSHREHGRSQTGEFAPTRTFHGHAGDKQGKPGPGAKPSHAPAAGRK